MGGGSGPAPGAAGRANFQGGGAKRSAAGDGVSRPPGGKRSAQRRDGAKASGIEARRGETPQAARCAARKPGPAGETPEESRRRIAIATTRRHAPTRARARSTTGTAAGNGRRGIMANDTRAGGERGKPATHGRTAAAARPSRPGAAWARGAPPRGAAGGWAGGVHPAFGRRPLTGAFATGAAGRTGWGHGAGATPGPRRARSKPRSDRGGPRPRAGRAPIGAERSR